MVSIYALINPTNNDVFYIGASTNPLTRLNQHRSDAYPFGSRKSKTIYYLKCENKDPELFILDISTFEEAPFLEVFYTDLYRSYGFDIPKCIQPYNHFDRRLARQKTRERPYPYSNTISGKIDGKDIHHYRREVFKHFNFYQHI